MDTTPLIQEGHCFSALKCCGQHLRFGMLPYRKRIPSKAKLWIYVPVISNTCTHNPTSCGCVQEKPIKSNISTGHKINFQIVTERHTQAVLPMLGISRTKNITGEMWDLENVIYGTFLASEMQYIVTDSRGRTCCTMIQSLLIKTPKKLQYHGLGLAQLLF